MNTTDNFVLAIESAIAGGSISLQKNGIEIDNWLGSSNVSKAEDLLVNIHEILTSNNISRRDISLIAASAGPGSFTGIRIGLATSLGLKAGLSVTMSSASALKAIASAFDGLGMCVVAVPVGRNSVCVQRFNIDVTSCLPLDEPHTFTDSDFSQFVKSETATNMVLHSALFERFESSPNITDFGVNIAYAIGQLCTKSPGVTIAPLFISKSF